MIWENGIETCKISCMKRVASPASMHDTGCLGLVHWDDPDGCYGEGGGRRVQYGEHMYMEFRKMLTMTLYARQQKKHRWKEQTFGLCGRR